MNVEGIFNSRHLLLVSEYWMRHRLFKTYCNKTGRAGASDRFTSSILNLLDCTRLGRAWGVCGGGAVSRSGARHRGKRSRTY